MRPSSTDSIRDPDDTAAQSLAHWSEAGRAEMEAFYALATEDYRQLALAADWPARLGAVARPGWRVLDVACGSGKFPTALSRYADLTGLPAAAYDLLDPSAFSIAEARAQLAAAVPGRPRELVITLQDLPADAGPYDVVWATHALYALPPAELATAAERFVGALRPGGLGFVAQATARSHYLAFYDAFRAGVRERTPYTSAEQVAEALRASRSAGAHKRGDLHDRDRRPRRRRGLPAAVCLRRHASRWRRWRPRPCSATTSPAAGMPPVATPSTTR